LLAVSLTHSSKTFLSLVSASAICSAAGFKGIYFT
jgi:hypothetical protein